MNSKLPQNSSLDYSPGARGYGPFFSWSSLAWGAVALFLPAFGPQFRAFNWIPIEHEDYAYVLAFAPGVLAIYFAVIALATLPKMPKSKLRDVAALGLVLPLLGLLLCAVFADMNWPYAPR